MGESTNSIRKELNHLHDAGYLEKVKKNNKIEYKAITSHPLFDTLKKIILKHLGLEDIVETVLERMGNVSEIIVTGDYAEGIDSGRIDIVLVGKDLDFNYTSQLETKIEKLINRKVSFFLTSRSPEIKPRLILFSQ